MPGATVDHKTKTFVVSQSALQTFQRCPQQLWFEMNDPRPGHTGETAVGQAMHMFMESRLGGGTFGFSMGAAVAWLDMVVHSDPDFRFAKVKTYETMLAHLKACVEGMEQHVFPQVPRGGLIEQTMRCLLCTDADGWSIVLEGTPDYIDTEHNRIYDWKSAGQAYKVHETVAWTIQPTAYTFLASECASVGEVNEFTYCVAIKPHGDMQLIDLTRGPGDWRWLARIAMGALALLRALPDGGWPVVHNHHLCSATWCPWWDSCRGLIT